MPNDYITHLLAGADKGIYIRLAYELLAFIFYIVNIACFEFIYFSLFYFIVV